jgi:hypothetical protein
MWPADLPFDPLSKGWAVLFNFLYLNAFSFSIFSCNLLCVALWIPTLPLHDHRLAPFFKWFSLYRWVSCCCSATSNAAQNSSTGKGGPASYMGYPLPRAPGSVGCKPCGQGSPPLRPDGAGQYGRVKVVDEGDDYDVEDNEDLNSSSSDRWVPRSGTPGCVVCALGPLGLGCLWFSSQGTASGILGLPLLFPGLPLILESI